jgi:hypothetical protein
MRRMNFNQRDGRVCLKDETFLLISNLDFMEELMYKSFSIIKLPTPRNRGEYQREAELSRLIPINTACTVTLRG